MRFSMDKTELFLNELESLLGRYFDTVEIYLKVESHTSNLIVLVVIAKTQD